MKLSRPLAPALYLALAVLLALPGCYAAGDLWTDSESDDQTSTDADDSNAGDENATDEADESAGDDSSSDDSSGDDSSGEDSPGDAEDVIDNDGDGWGTDDDCNDSDPQMHPTAIEVCDDLDNDCDGEIDEELTPLELYRDFDQDGWGSGVTAVDCAPTSDWVLPTGDCNDPDPAIHPDATETCNAIDDDCDGTADDSAVCPCELFYHPDSLHPYLFCAVEGTWYDAQADCASYGYALVTFDSQAELDWATTTAVDVASSNPWWIGFTDEGQEGNWTWEDGSPPNYLNWCGGEPNNSHGHECYPADDENCGMLNWGAGGCWNDYPCMCDTIHYICEGNSEYRPTN